MGSYDYGKGFVGDIDVEPVRIACTSDRRGAVHARVVRTFVFGRFIGEAGEVLCGIPRGAQFDPVDGSINDVSCHRCRTMLDRWSVEAYGTKCYGFVLCRPGYRRAVAARSAALAGRILGVTANRMSRSASRSPHTLDVAGASLGEVPNELLSYPYGTVIECADGDDLWEVTDTADRTQVEVIASLERDSGKGQVLSEVRSSYTLRMDLEEVATLKLLGGASWIRQKAKRAKRPHVDTRLGVADGQYTLRATDSEWNHIQALGAAPWVRTIIRKEMVKRGRAGRIEGSE